VRLEESCSLNDNYSDDQDEIDQSTFEGSSLPDNSVAMEQVQAQYQAQRSNGMSISLARLGLTAVQLGFALFLIVISNTDFNGIEAGEDSSQNPHTTVESAIQIVGWFYALILSLIHIIRPQAAFNFSLRPMMDLFYVLEFAIMSLRLYENELVYLPSNFWPLWLKLDLLAWACCALLLWVSLVTRPYQVPIAVKKTKEDEVCRLPSPEYSSSLYSQLTFSWVNPLVYLGYRRPLQDADLADIELHDYSVVSIRRYNLVK